MLSCVLALCMNSPRTLYQKIWDAHVVDRNATTAPAIIFIDRHLVHEVTSPQAFAGLRTANGRSVRRPDLTLAVPDHNLPTTARRSTPAGATACPSRIQKARQQLAALGNQCRRAFGVPYIDAVPTHEQGIVHVVGPEQGFTLPGTDHGMWRQPHRLRMEALGALAFGIGTSEVEHVLGNADAVAQAVEDRWKCELMAIWGPASPPRTLILHIIGAVLGTAGGTGHVIEFRGSTIEATCRIEGRLTVSNMAIEAWCARRAYCAPDEKDIRLSARAGRNGTKR